MQSNWRPDLSDESVVLGLEPRESVYFNILEYCRHIGVQVHKGKIGFWIARVRRRDGGYAQKRLCLAFQGDIFEVDYNTACFRAKEWFKTPSVSRIASASYPLGSKRQIDICPIGDVHTVGHALRDYLDWKLLAATKSHFETLVSLINYHLVPRVSQIPLAEFDGNHFQKLATDVLSTPPKYGRETPAHRDDLRLLSQNELRKRKKTFNALVSILKGAFELSWEKGNIESDRPMRCLRRLPNVERPRVVFLDRKECRRLLGVSHPDLRILIMAALYTGCRANELILMRCCDFSPETKSVYVASPKGRRTRHVLSPAHGVNFFRSVADERPGNDRLFRKKNGRVWGGEYRHYFLRARKQGGFPAELTFHGLRHTYASQLLQDGASIISVADQLGHANTQTVSTTYGHLTARTRANDIDRCFAPIFDGEEKTKSEGQETSLNTLGRLPVFRHRDLSSWPRSNHSRYSGQLLQALRPNDMD